MSTNKQVLEFAPKWRKFLPPNQHGGPAPWGKLYCSLLDDEDWLEWSWTERGVWIALLMLRSRLGQSLPSDRSKVVLMLGTAGKRRQDALRVITERTLDGNLVLCSQHKDSKNSGPELEKSRVEKDVKEEINEEAENPIEQAELESEKESKSESDEQKSESNSESDSESHSSVKRDSKFPVESEVKSAIEEKSKSPVEPNVEEAPSASQEASLPEITPVPYLSKNSQQRNPKVERLVAMYLKYQANGSFNNRETLLIWHAAFSRLLKQQPNLEEVLKYNINQGYWSDGKLRQSDPMGFLEDKLGKLVNDFNKYLDICKRRKQLAAQQQNRKSTPASAPTSAPVAAGDNAAANASGNQATEPLLTRGQLVALSMGGEVNGVTGRQKARRYVKKHIGEYQELDWWNDPENQEDMKFRAIILYTKDEFLTLAATPEIYGVPGLKHVRKFVVNHPEIRQESWWDEEEMRREGIID